MTKRSWWVEKIWACSLAGVLFLLSFCLSMSFAYGGLGITIENGAYVLRQGAVRASIDQHVGVIFYLASEAMLVAVLLAVFLTIAVYLRSGSIRPAEVFKPAGAEGRRYVTLVFVGAASFCLPLILMMVDLFGLMPWRR